MTEKLNWFEKKIKTLPDFSIKGFKTWDTFDGNGYQGTLIYKKKAAAIFHDDGNGGETKIEYLSPAYQKIIKRTVKQINSEFKTPETLIAIIADKIELLTKLKTKCRINTLVIYPFHKEGEYNQIPRIFTPEIKEKIITMKKDNTPYFINEHINENTY